MNDNVPPGLHRRVVVTQFYAWAVRLPIGWAFAAIPEDYEDRPVEMFPGAYQHLRLMALILMIWPFRSWKEMLRGR